MMMITINLMIIIFGPCKVIFLIYINFYRKNGPDHLLTLNWNSYNRKALGYFNIKSSGSLELVIYKFQNN